jgi:ABC-type polar amino acid transport system ATPase subunit
MRKTVDSLFEIIRKSAEEEIEELTRESLTRFETISKFKDFPQRFSGDQIASRGEKSKHSTA